MFTASDHGEPRRDPLLALHDLCSAGRGRTWLREVKDLALLDNVVNAVRTKAPLYGVGLKLEFQVFGGIDMKADVTDVMLAPNMDDAALARVQAFYVGTPVQVSRLGAGPALGLMGGGGGDLGDGVPEFLRVFLAQGGGLDAAQQQQVSAIRGSGLLDWHKSLLVGSYTLAVATATTARAVRGRLEPGDDAILDSSVEKSQMMREAVKDADDALATPVDAAIVRAATAVARAKKPLPPKKRKKKKERPVPLRRSNRRYPPWSSSRPRAGSRRSPTSRSATSPHRRTPSPPPAVRTPRPSDVAARRPCPPTWPRPASTVVPQPVAVVDDQQPVAVANANDQQPPVAVVDADDQQQVAVDHTNDQQPVAVVNVQQPPVAPGLAGTAWAQATAVKQLGDHPVFKVTLPSGPVVVKVQSSGTSVKEVFSGRLAAATLAGSDAAEMHLLSPAERAAFYADIGTSPAAGADKATLLGLQGHADSGLMVMDFMTGADLDEADALFRPDAASAITNDGLTRIRNVGELLAFNYFIRGSDRFAIPAYETSNPTYGGGRRNENIRLDTVSTNVQALDNTIMDGIKYALQAGVRKAADQFQAFVGPLVDELILDPSGADLLTTTLAGQLEIGDIGPAGRGEARAGFLAGLANIGSSQVDIGVLRPPSVHRP